MLTALYAALMRRVRVSDEDLNLIEELCVGSRTLPAGRRSSTEKFGRIAERMARFRAPEE